MSPKRIVADLIEAAVRRARALVIAEAAAWAASAAAAVFGLTRALGLGIPAQVIAIAAAEITVAVALGLSRRRAVKRTTVARALEGAHPQSRNLIVTATELSSGDLAATPFVRARVFADAAALSPAVDVRRAFPLTHVARAAAVAAVAWAAVIGVVGWRDMMNVAPGTSPGPRASSSSSPAAARGITVTIQPPAYTGLPPQTLNDPPQIEAVEGSTATLVLGRFTARAVLQKTGYLAVGDGEDRRTIPVVVSPDALPAVTMTAPGRDLVYAGGNPRIAFEARATDDFGLRSLTLQVTRVSGSGEQFGFEDGEIPLTISRVTTREWRGSASRSAAELKLRDGDMLVYRAVAADTRPGDGSASSDAFFIEISKLGVGAADAFTLPEEETRYALSQQMLIIKTRRLNERRSSLSSAELTDAALNLAVEQRMIRAELVFMLGGEVEDEEVEAERSTELQEGRLQNRGQRDLRAATIAMSQAEKLLTGISLPEALAAERAAVEALQRAFARDRYLLRALGSRTSLDTLRRLTGDVSSAAGWNRAAPNVPENRRVALLQDLLQGLAELQRSTQNPLKNPSATSASSVASEFRSRARVLAEEALRIEASSPMLRRTATELERAAGSPDEAGRQRALGAATTAVLEEARRSSAAAPLPVTAAGGSLSGALADALSDGARRIERSGRQ